MAKVGRRDNIVTKYYQGGKIYTIEQLLKMKGFSPDRIRTRTRSLAQKAVKIARTLSQKHAGSGN
ncbi:hypothetical protein PN4B1_00410 [Paenibacillus naphthalenovorans]|nr:hypothetical protein PN4B1_00410 [Paenibacillus naphthalenovorans]